MIAESKQLRFRYCACVSRSTIPTHSKNQNEDWLLFPKFELVEKLSTKMLTNWGSRKRLHKKCVRGMFQRIIVNNGTYNYRWGIWNIENNTDMRKKKRVHGSWAI